MLSLYSKETFLTRAIILYCVWFLSLNRIVIDRIVLFTVLFDRLREVLYLHNISLVSSSTSIYKLFQWKFNLGN